jgi:hypothetical protein
MLLTMPAAHITCLLKAARLSHQDSVPAGSYIPMHSHVAARLLPAKQAICLAFRQHGYS